MLWNELPTFHSYLIPEHGLHSIDTLINNPDQAFEESVGERLEGLEGDPLVDFREAARCLAFGFSTACGFHVVRAAEAVLRNWYKLSNSAGQFETEWAKCVDGIRSSIKDKPDSEGKGQTTYVLNVLDHIRNDRRNPGVHPQITLDGGESQAVFDVTKSAILLMMKEMYPHSEP